MATETNVMAGEDLGAPRRRPLGLRRKGQRPRQFRETSELVAMVRRVVRTLGQRAAAEDPETLLQLQQLRGDLDAAILCGVAGQRAAGVTWEAIGLATGTTRQAAIMKWSTRI